MGTREIERNYSSIENGKKLFTEYKEKYSGKNATTEMKRNTDVLKEYARLGHTMRINYANEK